MLGGKRSRTTLAGVLASAWADDNRRPPRVAVIARRPERLAELGADVLAADGVEVLPLVGLDLDAMHDVLSAYSGRGLVVVDARPSNGRLQVRAFQRLFFHLVEGDAWVALRSRGASGAEEPLVDLARVAPDDHDREPFSSIGRVRVTEREVVLEKSRPHLLKLRDRGATELLRAREPRLRVSELATLPAGTLVPGGSITDHPAAPATGAFPTELPYPEAHLRRYDGRVELPGSSVAIHGRSVLPDSFRWHLTGNPVNRGIRTINSRFAHPKPTEPPAHLAGSYYFFGYNNPGHFGHLMTEGLAKLWGWDEAKRRDPDLRLLCREHPRRPGSVADRLEQVLLPAYGVDPGDIVWAAGPVAVDSLVGATPLWHNAPPYYVHPALSAEWRRLRAGLPDAALPDAPRIFVSRRPGGNRPCRNTAEVEALFAQHGFEIVRPERHGIPEQAALFAQARVVAGFGGSGMFNLLYAESLETVIVLNQSAYWGRSEHLFAALHGADAHVFWSEPEGGHPEGSYEAHQAAWEFDVGLHRAALTRLLDSV